MAAYHHHHHRRCRCRHPPPHPVPALGLLRPDTDITKQSLTVLKVLPDVFFLLIVILISFLESWQSYKLNLVSKLSEIKK